MPAAATAASRSRSNDKFGFDLLTASYDGTAAVWNVLVNQGNNYKFQGSQRTLQGHSDKVLNAVPVANPNKNVCDIVSTGADGRAMLWTAQSD